MRVYGTPVSLNVYKTWDSGSHSGLLTVSSLVLFHELWRFTGFRGMIRKHLDPYTQKKFSWSCFSEVPRANLSRGVFLGMGFRVLRGASRVLLNKAFKSMRETALGSRVWKWNRTVRTEGCAMVCGKFFLRKVSAGIAEVDLKTMGSPKLLSYHSNGSLRKLHGRPQKG